MAESTLLKNQSSHQLFEVDLGELKSMKDNQIHIDELKNTIIEQGQQIVDDSTIDAQKYKLVMIGREVTEKDYLLAEQANGQHILATDVFHESGEQFSKAVKLDEGVVKHYVRHIYLIVGMVFGVFTAVSMYQYSFQILPLYEDYLDWVIFQHVKRGRSVQDLGRAFYENDRYSVESRSN